MGFRNMIPIDAKMLLYKAAILPDLTYCHTIWNFCRSSDSRKLERIQEQALRAIYNTKTELYENLLSKAKLPSLRNRQLQDILVLMYKVKNSMVPKNVHEVFLKQDKNYNLRSCDFPIPRVNTTKYGKHSLRYTGPYLWGKIDKELRNKPSLASFKTSIRSLKVEDILNGACSCIACST